MSRACIYNGNCQCEKSECDYCEIRLRFAEKVIEVGERMRQTSIAQCTPKKANQVLLDAVHKMNCMLTEIIVMNPWDIIELDMSQYHENVWFFSSPDMGRGMAMKAENGELKQELYDFLVQHPDKCWKGTKQYDRSES